MTRSRLDDTRARGLRVESFLKLGGFSGTVATATQLTDDFGPVCALDATGGVTVKLPAITTENANSFWFFRETGGAGTLTITTSADGAVATVAAGTGCLIVESNGTYYPLSLVSLAGGTFTNLSATGNVALGDATSDTLAFHGATPVAQRAGAAQAAVVTTATTQTTPYGFATQAQGDAIVALVNELRAAVVALGLIKGAA